ncbi:hypothetical protein TWF225_000201 [Orbilia oligospora]|uniref:Uncharacterized protein n=1 Tax=Orbilia oligospora TaxID=2813651 RepID=A0A7C8U7N7_ORBOL|nr:hypothetical protein TWF751_004234 [Orbilia oligospora]KAF3195826.1 hypothetical protein TWF225_000201 [Orbilia oligospora]KAF3266406.1 hypothetical protein TWF128_010814 [Orbilia oligospora]KAF3272258.1 hypothetical protein TWF217_004053 [Orbilia oligospora]KAF3297572.1 hypothetical protein TWF132_005992 [Orbilia oligospora]
MRLTFIASVFIVGVVLHALSAIAAPYPSQLNCKTTSCPGNWNNQTKYPLAIDVTPSYRTTQLALTHRGILTILNLPILIPVLAISLTSTATATGIEWPAKPVPLKASASVHEPERSNLTSSVASLSASTSSSTEVVRQTTTLTLTQTEQNVVVDPESTYSSPIVSAHVPVRYVYNRPAKSTGPPPQDLTSQRRIKPRVYVTETILYTVTAPAYVVTITNPADIVTKTTLIYQPGPPTTITLITSPLHTSKPKLVKTIISNINSIFSSAYTGYKPTNPTPTPKPKSTLIPPTHSTPSGQGNPRCNGLFRYQTNRSSGKQYRAYYYFDYDFAVYHINKYCNSLKDLPNNYNQNGIRLTQIGATKDRNAFNIGVYWPANIPGTKPQAEICIYYFRSILLDGCDGNDPNNPLNWKGGGSFTAVDQRGIYRRQIYYEIEAIGRRKNTIKQRLAQCFKQVQDNKAKLFVRGAGWAGDIGLVDLKRNVNEACGGIVEYWEPVSTINKAGEYEWQLDLGIPADQEKCFLEVVRRNYGAEVQCGLIPGFGSAKEYIGD